MAAPENTPGPGGFAEHIQPSQTPAEPKDRPVGAPVVAVVATRPATVLQTIPPIHSSQLPVKTSCPHQQEQADS